MEPCALSITAEVNSPMPPGVCAPTVPCGKWAHDLAFPLARTFYFFRLSTMEFTEYGDWPWRARNSHSLQAIRVEPLLVSFVAIVRRAPPAAHTYGATSLGLG